ncbi:MAG: carbohydrate ABC transporter permease [Eubacteriales bacterium]|nr:carbohydrate ABC transporter permease [Eubacteriales bacterium]
MSERRTEIKIQTTPKNRYRVTPTAVKKRSRLANKITGGRSNRSVAGTIFLFFVILLFALFSLFPVVFMIGNAFKPLSELFRFPPTLLPQQATLENFRELRVYAAQSFVPFLRYLFNTLFVVLLGCTGMVGFSAMAAFPIAKYDFKGRHFLTKIIEWALLFTTAVLAVPTYLIMAKLQLVDSYWAIILPAWGSSLGLYLLINFMGQVPDSLIEAASIDGASPFLMLWRIIMPAVKPAWITVFIFSFQALWGNTGGTFIYSEELKPLSYMLTQIASAGIARAGVASATALIMFIIPVLVFIISQSNILETMTTSGMKE